MQARDATGRKVSLLNDDSINTVNNNSSSSRINNSNTSSSSSSSSRFSQDQNIPPSLMRAGQAYLQRYSAPHRNSCCSSPDTPELLRSNSYDSQMSTDSPSPLTPSVDFSYPKSSIFPVGYDYGAEASPAKRPACIDRSRAASYEDDSANSSVPERAGKRYPCRYRDSHGCEKTFTTSGHASRHSKIHTAEKAVQCTYFGCHKKFTRADNMKQHLETHYKDKSRSSSNAQRAHKAALADARRSSTSSNRSRSSTTGRETASSWASADHHPTPQYPLPASSPPSSWHRNAIASMTMRDYTLPPAQHPATMGVKHPSNGLHTLALAVACQESARV